MTISMYQASAPRFANMLRNLSALIDKAEAHCTTKKIDPAALTSFRLYPDMFAFTRQVQSACDTAKGAVARRFKGMQYLLGFAYPNFYCHVTTAYNILRHNGVELGKTDFIGKP